MGRLVILIRQLLSGLATCLHWADKASNEWVRKAEPGSLGGDSLYYLNWVLGNIPEASVYKLPPWSQISASFSRLEQN